MARRSVAAAGVLVAVAAASLLGRQSFPSGTGRIEGRVVDAVSGLAVPGAEVRLQPVATPSSPNVSRSAPRATKTVAGGQFTFEEVATGSYALRVVAEGYAAGAYGRTRPSGEELALNVRPDTRATDLVVRIWREAAITGTARDARGRPLAGASIVVLSRTVLGDESRYYPRTPARADASGRYRVAGLMPGEYFVGVSVTQVTLPLSVEDRFTRLQADGRAAMADLMQPLVTSASWLPNLTGPVIGEHRLQEINRGPTTPGPPAGDGSMAVYQSTMYPSSTSLGGATPVAVGPGETRFDVDISVPIAPGSRVSGRLAGPDGAPAPFLGLHLIRAPEPRHLASDLAFEVASTVSDELGRYTLLGVAPGAYELWAVRAPLDSYGSAPSLPPADRLAAGMRAVFSRPDIWARERVVVTGAAVENLDVRLRSTLRVSGVVSFDGEAPPDPSTQSALLVGAAPIGPYAFPQPDGVPIGADGRFEVRGFVPGVYRIQGRTAGGWRPASATAGGRDVLDRPFELAGDLDGVHIVYTKPRTSLVVDVQLNPGEDRATVGVVVFPASVDDWVDQGTPARWFQRFRAPAPGQPLGVPDLPAGRYVVAAFVDEDARHFDRRFFRELVALGTPITLVPGESTSVRVGVVPVR